MLVRAVALLSLSFFLSAASACNPVGTYSSGSSGSSSSYASCELAYEQWKTTYTEYQAALTIKKSNPSYDTGYWYERVLQAKSNYEKACD